MTPIIFGWNTEGKMIHAICGDDQCLTLTTFPGRYVPWRAGGLWERLDGCKFHIDFYFFLSLVDYQDTLLYPGWRRSWAIANVKFLETKRAYVCCCNVVVLVCDDLVSSQVSVQKRSPRLFRLLDTEWSAVAKPLCQCLLVLSVHATSLLFWSILTKAR